MNYTGAKAEHHAERLSLYNGDCLEVMKNIESGSVDAIITDPPYGTTELSWDKKLNFLHEASRVLKDTGVLVLFSQSPLTGLLHTNKEIKHQYDTVWVKNKTTRFLDAKYRPMSKFETISVLGRYAPCNANKGKFTYNPQGIVSMGMKRIKHKKKSTNCTSRGNYEGEVRESFTGYPSNVIEFATVGKERVHPTQKPVALMEYLIKTYTNEGETVLDFTMGSGSTGVACVNTKRNFIGIEQDEKYFQIATERIENETKRF